MSLSDLASLGSFVSGAAVLASLVFLFFQMRQMTEQVKQAEKNQMATIRQNRAIHTASMQMMLTNPEVAEAVSKGQWGDEDITTTQFDQYSRYMRTMLLGAEDSFYQHGEGLLSDSAYATYVGGLRLGFGTPGYRAMWRQNRSTFPPDFVAFMDSVEAKAHISSGDDRLSRWLAQVAVEKAKFRRG